MSGTNNVQGDEQDLTGYVYYASADYATFWRRVAALIVDVAALALLAMAYSLILDQFGMLSLERGNLPAWFMISFIIVAYLYLTLLKRSPVRTPGYWLTGLRIVDLRGSPPSMFLMTVRLLWWVLGPVNPLLDLLFIMNDDHAQTIRDKLIGTYVIKKEAQPAGLGRKVFGQFSFVGLMLLYPVVQPVLETCSPPADG
jgi:uncharacterized RDD family membrane protein YckC